MREGKFATAQQPSAVAAAVLASLVAASAGGDTAAANGPAIRNHLQSKAARAALERAATGALRRLQDPECQRVLDDFRNARGLVLRERLVALGETGASYLASRMWFVDGSGTRACQSSQTVAVTGVGSSVVFVCDRQLRQRGFSDPDHVETVLIHELLHSLGLGENPPSSDEINAQVARRCVQRRVTTGAR